MNSRYATALALTVGLVGFSVFGLTPWAQAGLVDLQLYGTNNSGWGKDPGNMSKPGPYLTYSNGTQLRLTLHSQDGAAHNFFVDYNGDRDNASEPSSGTFSTLSGTTFTITLNKTGNFTYRCWFHPVAMTGKINITAATGGTGGTGGGLGGGIGLDLNLIIILAIVAAIIIAGVAVFLRMRGHKPGREEEEVPPPRGPLGR